MTNKRNNHKIETPTPWTPPILKKKRKGVVVDNKQYVKVQLSKQAQIRLMNDIENKDFIDDTFLKEKNRLILKEKILGEYGKLRIARLKRHKRNTWIVITSVALLVIYGFTH